MYEKLLQRRSVRKYKPEQITDELLDAVLEAGLYAPTAKNNQKPVKLKAGNKYVVKFQVYGASTITTDVSLEPWHPGGKLEVDTEYDKPNI